MHQPKLFQLVCKCGKSIEVIGERTKARCNCKKIMVQVASLHPLVLYRYKHNLTQKELSNLLDVDRSLISKIETNNFRLSDKVIRKIKRITELNL
jgi:Helix-turn-helix.